MVVDATAVGTHRVDVGDGVLEVEVAGRGTGPATTVVVVQTALDTTELRPLCAELARGGGIRVAHQQRRGYGSSGPVAHLPTVVADAADTVAVLRTLGAGPVVVVGASFSAAVALEVALAAPDLLRGLVLVEPPPVTTAGAAGFREAGRELVATGRALGPVAAVDDLMTRLDGDDWRGRAEAGRPGSVAAVERGAATFLEVDLPALLRWRPDEVAVAAVPCPVLLVGGSDSPAWFGEARQRLRRLLPRAVDTEVPGAGHLVASTHAAAVADLVRERLP